MTMNWKTFSFLLPLCFATLSYAADPLPAPPANPEIPHFLENLAVVQPEVTARLPAPTVSDHEWRGLYCGVTQEDTVIFRHTSDWTLFWDKAMRPYSSHFETMPPIDFSKDMVIGVFLGEKKHRGYDVQMTGFKKRIRKQDQQEVLVVQYKKIKRPVGVFVPPMAIQPFHLLRLPLYTGPIYFREMKR